MNEKNYTVTPGWIDWNPYLRATTQLLGAFVVLVSMHKKGGENDDGV